MAGQCWPSNSPHHQSQNGNHLQLLTMVTSSSSSSAASSSLDASPQLIHTNNKFPATQSSAASRMASSTLYQALASNTTVSSSSSSGISSSSLSPGHFLNVQQQLTTQQSSVSTYGQSLAKLASLHSKKQSALGAIHFSSAFSDSSDIFTHHSVPSPTTRTVPAHPSSPSALSVQHNNGSIAEASSPLLRVASPQRQQQQQQLFKPAAALTLPMSLTQMQPALIPSTPVKGCSASTQASFPQMELCSGGSPISSSGSQSCESSLDNFLSPSPYYAGGSFVAADSPSASSTYNMGSPDTTVENMTVDTAGDGGYSDHITTTTTNTTSDKSTSPQPSKTGSQESAGVDAPGAGGTSPSKRKRVRKSRAKQQPPQNPSVKTAVKRTRRVRANDRERTRMHGLNDAMDVLRNYLPCDGAAGKLTKIDTLRTAANYIRVLKMLLGEIDKGEDMSSWPSDMIAAVNNLYSVQPAASPDSTGFVSSTSSSSLGPHGGISIVNNAIPCNDGRLQQQQQQQQHCGVVNNSSVGVGSDAITSQPVSDFSGYMQNDNFNLVADSYNHGNGGVGGGVLPPPPSYQLPAPGNFPASPNNNNVSMITASNDFTSGVSSTAINNDIVGYNMNDFASNVMNNTYSSPLFAATDDCSAAQNMIFQQSSQCY